MRYPLVIVTGLSGSGKTTALKTLEDYGFEVIDNLPISLCTALIAERQERTQPLVLGIDIRSRGFSVNALLEAKESLHRAEGKEPLLLFFEAHADTLELRYRETRRLHPLGGDMSISHLIVQEQELLEPLKPYVHHVINTTTLSPPEMKSFVLNLVDAKSQMPSTIYCTSFSYRRGVPSRADFVFDMRFLPNPYYHKDMKFLTGKAERVSDYLETQPLFQRFIQAFRQLDFMMPNHSRPSFVLAFGCSGGRHRSVYTAEVALKIMEEKGYNCALYHRDLV